MESFDSIVNNNSGDGNEIYLETRTSGITIVFVMLFRFFFALFWFYSAIFQDTVTISSIVSNLF